MEWLKRQFTAPSANEVATKELAEARLQLLESQSAMEYATSMVAYHTQRIERLNAYLTERVQ